MARETLLAQKEARGRKFVLVAAGKEMRVTQHVTRSAGSVKNRQFLN